MGHVKHITVRELHLQTSAILRAVAEGESFIIEKSAIPIAELRPFEKRSSPRMPNREAILSKMPRVGDSGRILEEDRS
jgi:antitoxin (DNA-binding transcriptional repressor) of toxin-antitoxin stability system